MIIAARCDVEKNKSLIKNTLNNWEYSKDKQRWFTAYIPESIINHIKRDSLIDNYFLYKNPERYSFIFQRFWFIKGRLSIPYELSNRKIELTLNQIIGKAELYINNKFITTLNSSYAPTKIDITNDVIKGDNIIELKFKAFQKTKNDAKIKSKYNLKYGGIEQLRIPKFYTDTTQNTFYLPIGITKNIEILLWKKFKIDNVYFQTLGISKNNDVKLKITYQITSDNDYNAKINLINQKDILINKHIKIKKGTNNYSFFVKIEKAKLWYPYELGEPHQYQLKTIITHKAKEIATSENDIGFRKISIDTTKNQFVFSINNKTLKLKVFDYLPFHPQKNNETDYSKLIDDIKTLGINMLHVKEEGMYENIEFYQACNKAGILIWHDFMLPYKEFDTSDNFINIIEEETIKILKQLRNNTSIAFWSGENNTIINDKNLQKINKKIFAQLLPELVENYDSSRIYFEKINKKQFGKLDTKIPSFPTIITLRQIVPQQDMSLNKIAIKKIIYPKEYEKNLNSILKLNYGKINDIASIMYASYIESYIETDTILKNIFTSQKQYNVFEFGKYKDVTPIISTSSVDYQGYWKSKFYAIKKWNSPYIFNVKNTNGQIDIFVGNNTNKEVELDFTLKLVNFNGKVFWRRNEKNIKIKPQNFDKYFNYNITSELNIAGNQNCVLKIEAYNKENMVGEYYFTFEKDKKLELKKPKFDVKFFKVTDGYTIELTSNVYAKYVYIITSIYGTLSNNFFEIIPGETKKIYLKTNVINQDLTKLFKIIDYSQLYESSLFDL